MKRTTTIMITIFAITLLTFQGASADVFPFKLFDAHAHLMSPDTDAYPRSGGMQPAGGGSGRGGSGGRDNAGGPGNGGPGGKDNAGGSAVGERELPEINSLLALMADIGVESAAAVQKRGTYGYDNSYILDSCDQHPDKMLPVVVLDPEDVNTDDLVLSWTTQRNLSGVRYFGNLSEEGTLLSSFQAKKTWELANRYGLVVDIMVNGSPETIAEIIRLARTYENAKIVLDHVAFPNAEGAPDYGITELYQRMASQKNIYYKFTTINLDLLEAGGVSSADMLRRVVNVFGADHIMWGSDVGNSVGKYAQLVERMVEATSKLTAAEKQAVMHDTGKRVFVGGGSGTASAPVAMQAPPSGGPGPASTPAVGPSLDSALALAQAALSACKAKGAAVVVSVVDSSGKTKVTLAADGSTGKATTAVRKASTAVTFKASGSEMEARAKTDTEFADLIAANPTDYNNHAGSMVLKIDGEIIGGIGITGAPNHNLCEECCQAAVENITMTLQ